MQLSSDEWFRYVLGMTPLWVALLAVLVTSLVIISRHRATGVLLLCAACLGLTTVLIDPVLSNYFFTTLVGEGWTFEQAQTAYMLTTSSSWGVNTGLFLWAALVKRNQGSAGPGFSVYPAEAYYPQGSYVPPRAGQPPR